MQGGTDALGEATAILQSLSFGEKLVGLAGRQPERIEFPNLEVQKIQPRARGRIPRR